MLYIVGIGPGCAEMMTSQAYECCRRADMIVGYTVYAELMKKIFPEKEYHTTGMKKEEERVRYAMKMAETADVALICSGDAGIYGLAWQAYSMSGEYAAQIEVVPGISASISGAALLGSPLTCDHAVISLSDLLVPKERIEKRLRACAAADMVTVLYNPSSKKRADYLAWAADIFLEHRPAETVCGYARNIGREGQEWGIMTLSELREFEADMFTTVFIGNSDTKVINGKMVTMRA